MISVTLPNVRLYTTSKTNAANAARIVHGEKQDVDFF